eukprot:175494_1
MTDIFDAVIGYIQSKSIVPNLKIKIKSISKKSFLHPDISWLDSDWVWTDYFNETGKKSIIEYKKEDIIKQGLQLEVSENDIELYTELAKARKEALQNAQTEYDEWRASCDMSNSIWIAPRPDSDSDEYKIRTIDVRTSDAFCANFTIHASYEQNETVHNIFEKVINYMEKAHDPIKLKIDGQHMSGFQGEYTPTTYDFDTYVKAMGDFSITEIHSENTYGSGWRLPLKAQFKLKIKSDELTCNHLRQLKSTNPMECPIYCEMKANYQFTKENLMHLQHYSHFTDEYEQKPVCRHNGECKAYIRCENGGNRLDDRCHMKIFRHPPRKRQIELSKNLHPLTINKKEEDNHSLYYPSEDDKKQYDETTGFLDALVNEIIDNGFKSDLCLRCGPSDNCQHDEHSLLQIVNEKMNCKRHKSMGSPLNKAEMLSLVLYTGCDCNYDLCKTQRKGDYKKWKWFDYCLYNAIATLSSKELGDFDVFSGLNGVKLDSKSVTSGWFVTYVSSSWKKEVALTFLSGSSDEGMLIKIDSEYKRGVSTYHSPGAIYCCDVSWISKFQDECEVLFARSPDGSHIFSLHVLDDSSGIQRVKLDRKDTFHGWVQGVDYYIVE